MHFHIQPNAKSGDLEGNKLLSIRELRSTECSFIAYKETATFNPNSKIGISHGIYSFGETAHVRPFIERSVAPAFERPYVPLLIHGEGSRPVPAASQLEPFQFFQLVERYHHDFHARDLTGEDVSFCII